MIDLRVGAPRPDPRYPSTLPSRSVRSATAAADGKTFAGSGATTQYDLNGKVVASFVDFTFTATRAPG